MTKGRLPRILSRALRGGGGSAWLWKGLPAAAQSTLRYQRELLGSSGLLGLPPVRGKLSCRSCSRSPGLLVGSDGLGQPVQAVQVVVRGEELLAGGTNGSCLEAPPEHTCRGEEAARASSGQPGRASPAAASSVPPAPLTGHVRGLLQAVVGAAVLGALHEVGRLVHVLGRRGALDSGGDAAEGQGRSWEPHPRALPAGERPLTIHMPSKGTWSWKSFSMSCHHSCVLGLVKSGKAVGPGHTCRREAALGRAKSPPSLSLSLSPPPAFQQPLRVPLPLAAAAPLTLSPQPQGQGLMAPRTFPMRGCPVAFRMNTPRFSPSS